MPEAPAHGDLTWRHKDSKRQKVMSEQTTVTQGQQGLIKTNKYSELYLQNDGGTNTGTFYPQTGRRCLHWWVESTNWGMWNRQTTLWCFLASLSVQQGPGLQLHYNVTTQNVVNCIQEGIYRFWKAAITNCLLWTSIDSAAAVPISYHGA